MATILDGILGSLYGRIGPVTGYRRNGATVLRIASRRKDHVITPARLAQREKIKLCNQFTPAFKGSGFFAKTFPAHGHTGTGLQRATSALMNLAITGTYPNLLLSYPNILISKGLPPGAVNSNASIDSQGNCVFSWTDNSEVGTARVDDKVVLVSFFPETGHAVFSVCHTVKSDEFAVLDLNGLQSQSAQTWIAFLSADEKEASDSVWCGKI